MNFCIISAEVIDTPLSSRTNSDSHFSTVLVQFHSPYEKKNGSRSQSTVTVIGWGELAQAIDFLQDGDRLMVSGQLKITSVERPEGFREKQLELIAQNLYPLR